MPNPKSEVHLSGKKAQSGGSRFMLATGKTQVDA